MPANRSGGKKVCGQHQTANPERVPDQVGLAIRKQSQRGLQKRHVRRADERHERVAPILERTLDRLVRREVVQLRGPGNQQPRTAVVRQKVGYIGGPAELGANGSRELAEADRAERQG
jgi:hypothetical protein